MTKFDVLGLCVGGTMLVLTGCSSGSSAPLMFGDTTTFGLRLGNDGATSGGSVSLGLKAQSVAIVPVTYLDRGTVKYLSGNNGSKGRDALSVFASFDSSTVAPTGGKPAVHLGQVFSTGLAAQEVTLGYLCRVKKTDEDCTAERTSLDKLEKDLQASNDAVLSFSSSQRPSAQTQGAGPTADESKDAEAPYQVPLLFARTDVYGVDIGGSLAQQGLQFVLGYGNRNVALIPTTARNGRGRTVQITGRDNASDDHERSLDVLSVMGQFNANTETTQLGYGLERYFATGMAARNLGKSVGLSIASQPGAAGGADTPDAASGKPGGVKGSSE